MLFLFILNFSNEIKISFLLLYPSIFQRMTPVQHGTYPNNDVITWTPAKYFPATDHKRNDPNSFITYHYQQWTEWFHESHSKIIVLIMFEGSMKRFDSYLCDLKWWPVTDESGVWLLLSQVSSWGSACVRSQLVETEKAETIVT